MVAFWLAGGIGWWGGFGPRWPGDQGLPAGVVLFWMWSVGLLGWLNWPSSPINLAWVWLALGWLAGACRAHRRGLARLRMVWVVCAGGSVLLNRAWPLVAREAGEQGGLWLPTLTGGLAGAAFAHTPFGAAFWALGIQLVGLGVNGEVGSRALASALAATMLAFALRWSADRTHIPLRRAWSPFHVRTGNQLSRYPDRQAEKGE